ncbi:MAG: hypothetical protein ACRDRK_13755 [Pseudonocardia sp.]
MSRGPVRLLVALCAAVAVLAACTATTREAVTLRVLASSELADMAPLLDDLRAATGVELLMDFQGTVDASKALIPGDYGYDLAWLSSDRYFQLERRRSGFTGPAPLRISTMLSPVVVGVTRGEGTTVAGCGWPRLVGRSRRSCRRRRAVVRHGRPPAHR